MKEGSKSKHTLFHYTIIIVLIVSSTFCSSQESGEVKKTVESFINSFQNEDYETLETVFPTFSEMNESKRQELTLKMQSFDRWEIVDVQFLKNTAQVKVRFIENDNSSLITFNLQKKHGTWKVGKSFSFSTKIDIIPLER